MEDLRGCIMETSTQVEPSKEGRKITREDERILQDARENVGAPSNLCRKRRSPERYTRYMALMIDLIETESSSLEEAIKKPVQVDPMVEEYESIMKNNVWEVVPILTNKLVMCSRWIFKVKHGVDISMKKYKAKFVAKGFSQVKGIEYEETFICCF